MTRVLFYHRDSENNCENVYLYYDENVAPSVEEVKEMQDDGQWVDRYTLSAGEDRLVSETLEEMADRLRGSRDGESIS